MKTIYVATYKGKGKLFNKIVRWLDNSEYSHTEIALVESEEKAGWVCASSSMMDGGVRFKLIDIHSGNWDLIKFTITEEQLNKMFDFTAQKIQEGTKYDYFGMLGAGLIVFRESKKKEFCNEFCGKLMSFIFEIKEPHRLRPASFHNMMLALNSAWSGGGA